MSATLLIIIKLLGLDVLILGICCIIGGLSNGNCDESHHG